MALKSALESTKARLNALLTYANETTGESDTSIGDAVQTLCAGYGGGGVDHIIEDALIQNSPMDEYVNDRVTEVKYYGFVKTNIKKIYLPNVTKVENSAFDGINDSLVEEIYIPNCTACGATTFARNPNLKIVDCGKVKVNTNGRFNYCPKLTTIIARRTDGLMAPSGADIISGPFAPDGTGGYVYVPQALLSQYRANESWQLHANVLEFRPIEGSEYELEE